MTQQSSDKAVVNTKLARGIRKIVFIFNQKVQEVQENAFQKIHVLSVKKSPEFLLLKCSQLLKRLSRVFTFKIREHFNHFAIMSTLIDIHKKQKHIQSTKLKDRVYEAKVKSLRVLSRQWKQKRSQNIYKNKYFTPKSQQTPKMIKQKVTQDVYLLLRNILRQKYLVFFNEIKTSQVIKIRNHKAVFLVNYLLHKRKYWLSFGLQKLKFNILACRQQKNCEQIIQLDTRLVPVQDSQIQSIKEKQQKLQSALDNVTKEKQGIEIEVDTEVNQIQSNLEAKKKEIQNLIKKKQKILLTLEQVREKNCSFQFHKDEIFHLIYTNFLTNLKIWSEMQFFDPNNVYISKSMVLEWLQVPAIQFQLDKICYKSEGQLKQMTQSMLSIIQQYERLRSDSKQIQLQQIYQLNFSSNGLNQGSSSYEQFSNKNKYLYKIAAEVLKQNSEVMHNMLRNLSINFQKMKGDNLQIDEA